MSAGRFTFGTYASDGGTIYPFQFQPETVQAWNPIPVGQPAANTPSAVVSRGKRSRGVNTRTARFRWQGSVPEGYETAGIIRLPIFTKTAWDALAKATDYAYLGSQLRLVGKTNETIL